MSSELFGIDALARKPSKVRVGRAWPLPLRRDVERARLESERRAVQARRDAQRRRELPPVA